MTLQETLLARGYKSGPGPDGSMKYGIGDSASIAITCFADGLARISWFSDQLVFQWAAEFGPGVDDALIVAFLDQAEEGLRQLRPLESHA